jgi:hypothetical protein
LLVKGPDLEAAVDAVVDALEVVDVVGQPIAISESSAEGPVVDMAEDLADPQPLHTEAGLAALPQLRLTGVALVMAARVAMAEEVMATRLQAVVDNLGGRLPRVDAPLFLFRYFFDSGTNT